MKYFLITIDTEADWFSFKENRVTNIFGIHFVQELCEKYHLKPTYLITYEVATKSESVNILKKYADKHLCEIGHHLHVWSTPPFFKPNKFGVEETMLEGIQAELPQDLFDLKMSRLDEAIVKNFGITARSHRAGKWGVDARTLHWLYEHGYVADSSLSPANVTRKITGIKKIISRDSSKIPNHPFYPSENDITENANTENPHTVLEVPVTGIKGDIFKNMKGMSIVRSAAYSFGYKGVGNMMFRPSDIRIPVKIFEHITRRLFESGIQWINFMFHSNELCLGTSPYSKNLTLNEQVRAKIECAFKLAHEYGYTGIFLKESQKYYKKKE